MSTLLKVEEVGIVRGDVILLADISLALAAGGWLVLHGPNGIGKTSFLRCVAGLFPAARGRIRVDHDSIAWVGHGNGLKPALSVRENLEFWQAIGGSGGSTILSALERLGLAGMADVRVHELSAGQRRRLVLARLLLCRRSLWLLDEPMTALDKQARQLLLELIEQQIADGGAVVVSTHQGLPTPLATTLDMTRFVPPQWASSPGQ